MARSRTKKTSTSGELDFASHVMTAAGLEADGSPVAPKQTAAERIAANATTMRDAFPTMEQAAEGMARASAPIPTGGNPSDDEAIGGAIPNWTKNLVVEVYAGAVIERVDDMNWQAKVLRRVDSAKATRFEAKNVAKWEGLGWYSSPGPAVRKVLQHLATTEPGRITLEQLADRVENLIRIMTPAVIAGERAKALDEAAESMHDPRDAELLRARARKLASSGAPDAGAITHGLVEAVLR